MYNLAGRRRLLSQDRREGGEFRVTLKRPSSSHHLVENGPKAEYVRARVHSFPFGLFGGHVGNGPHDFALFGCWLEGAGHVVLTCCSGFGKLRQAEVEYL